VADTELGTEVGTAWVTIIPSAKGFAKRLQQDIAKEFAGSDLDKAVAEALGKVGPVKLPVQPDVDPRDVPDEVPVPRRQRPRLPVELDPLVAQFQAQVRRDVANLAREVNAHIAVGAETSELRSEIAAQIREIERQLRAEVPTEPAGAREYEAKLRALVESAQGRVRAAIEASVEVDRAQAIREAEAAARAAERATDIDLKVDVDRDGVRQLGGLASGPLARLTAGIRELGSTVTDAASRAAQLGGSLSGALTSASGPVGLVIGGIVAIGTALAGATATAIALVPALYAVGGALGSLPGIAGGVVAAVGTLSLGLRGLSDHFKETARAGGGAGRSAEETARQIARATRGVEAAQRSLARAQREVLRAQEAVTRARREEQERLEDLSRAVRRARLDEEDAALRVLEAEASLRRARREGTRTEIARAELAVRQALLGLEEAKDATEDLTREQEEASRRGVEGSDRVRDALDRQRDAMDALASATEQLASAEEALQAARRPPGGGGGGGVGQELTRLAPAAARFVAAVKSLQPAFERLRLNVQQRLFAGLDKTIKSLATAWMPQLNKTLGAYATTFNGIIKDAGRSLSQRSFIDNMAAGAESARRALERVGKAISGPLIDAIGRLSRAAGPFIERLGDELARFLEDFSAWIAAADRSGALDSFFGRAADVLSDLFDIGRDVLSILGSILGIFFEEEDITTSPWQGFKKTLDDLAKWFEDEDNKQRVRDFFGAIREFATRTVPQAIADVQEAIDTVSGWIDTIDEWQQRLRAFAANVRTVLSEVARVILTLTGPIGALLVSFGRLRDGARTSLRQLLDAVRALPTQIRNAVGNLNNLLYNAGRAVVSGLIAGIRAAIPNLRSTLSWITSMIPNWKGPEDTDRRLLEPAGSAIITGLITGIRSQLPALRSELGDITAMIGDTPAVASYTPPAVSPPALVVDWAPGATGDPLLDALRELIRIRTGGSVTAALGTVYR